MTVSDERSENDPTPVEPAYDPMNEPNEPEDRGRPPLPIIISGVLIIALIGVGLAFLLPSGPVREVDQLIPTPAPTIAGQPLPTQPPLPEAVGDASSAEVIVEVGDGTIVRGDFVRYYQPGSDPTETLDQLIQIELVVQAAATEGVIANEAAVDERIAQIKELQAGGDPAMFQSMLDQAQIGTEENLRRLLLRDEVVQQMILRYTIAEQARARHILLSTEGITEEAQLADVQREAEALLDQIEGGADFATLATENSDDPGSAQNGGDLGWALRGLFVEPFDNAVFSMQVGERRLVQTQFGWHIIELLNAPEVRPLDNAGLLETGPGQMAFGETFLPWIEQLQQQAEAASRIKILIPAEQLVSAP
ncbi:MAG: peptidylprolyl isomerase [Oscillochloridaceae bacterium umkhey_bin13]